MDIEAGRTRIYSCPACHMDTPHSIRARRGEVCAVICSNCQTGSLVKSDELRLYQVKWEEELRQVLEHLHDGIEGDDPRD